MSKRGGARPGLSLGPKRESGGTFGGSWSREVTVTAGRQKPRTFTVGVSRGNNVRIAFRGNARGWTWHGYVRAIVDGTVREVWQGDVAGSTGASGLLEAAGVYLRPCADCGEHDGLEVSSPIYYVGSRRARCAACRANIYEKTEEWHRKTLTENRPGDAYKVERLQACAGCKERLVERPSKYDVQRYGAKTPLCGPCDEQVRTAATVKSIALELARANGTTPARATVTPCVTESARACGWVKVASPEGEIIARAGELLETLLYFLPKAIPASGTPERINAVWAALREVAIATEVLHGPGHALQRGDPEK